ncbi:MULTISPECIES: ECF-type riboflavin transporter substrate-binding protein [unclassified Streptococcus]|uniref:ECF-type riboflavin transporter substrate-binding protein n=1 Tax=unclassified Streptococcus TaxID=2608887 RepID=UPI001071F396|nr:MULTISPECIES: ECF-type riboflavin transporter substrate-binding protein [unclassified Streptococcus]MBF0787881.1 ECF-type riboflavin transporter substrate-binding protein [Streptococcus sp. 19428wC2_LYSM12]MCQ9211165.1 ECF-type riboflavin transporter substrate-binding protein [Streptococcus sp. B01]MCQ9214440.1 ECF-type riboflavin transporter substrate-binding protein [Streptococcus sp. O1]TFV05130.1 ECF-type riboflavin transporter substrate-binding protein [Streptococcus sp. LYSM12]
MKNNSIKTVVGTGIGAALFVVISLVINIPLGIPNTSVQLQYAVQSLLAILFGPIVGFLVGFIGHALKDSLQYGPWWSWIFASGLFGLMVGTLKYRLRISEGVFTIKDTLLFNGVQFLANILVWGVVAPILDVLVYHEPANKVFTQGLVAGSINAATVAIAGSLLLTVYAKKQVQNNSLSKDEN